MPLPNIVYIHTHDLGRLCEPMGYAIPAPNLMRLAREGVLFRQCHASAPSCAPSRAALLTGQHPHCCGMLGLPSPQLGYRLNDYSRHLAGFLGRQGYETALAGAQHEARGPMAPLKESLPYEHFLNHTSTGQQDFDPALTVSAAVGFLRKEHARPFFLSVGFLDPHRDNRGGGATFIESRPACEPADIESRARYCQPWPHMPDNAITRREMANFKMGVAQLDADVGVVLDALDEAGLERNTLVFFTTDHGPGVCESKCTLTDRGTGVVLIVRGPSDSRYGDAGAFNGGRVVDGLIQHLDLYPTVCEAIGAAKPDWLQGQSLLPLVRGEADEIHDAVFTEQTYHCSAVPRPLRAVRTQRYKYIRSYKADQPRGIDRGPAQEFWERHGYREQPTPPEMLFDLVFDPHEANNLAGSDSHRDILDDARSRLRSWMDATRDPLLDGRVPEPPARANGST